MKNPAKHNNRNTRGFTLVEMMVSMAIFAVVAVVAAGALLRIIDANKKAQGIQSAMTNINFALESMTRELRTGTKYACNNGDFTGSSIGDSASCSLSDGDGHIVFLSSEVAKNHDGSTCPSSYTPYNLIYVYKFKSVGTNFELYKAKQPMTCSAQSITDDDYTPVISTKNVTITGYNISVISDLDHPYPLASIRISGYAGATEKIRTYFTLQTAASAREQ